jgi:4-amino-4-deoxy-L-arabinose transferase-like glycosyltransferase
VLFAVLLAYLLASFAFLWRGPVAAVVAVVALFSMPRFFFHAHVATLDVPVAAMYFATAYAYWRSRQSTFWSFAVGLVFALALLTKLNAPFAVVPIVIFVLIERWHGFRRQGSAAVSIPAIPIGLLSMLLCGPVLFVALWPHLWFDTFKRIGEYFAFHLNHYPIYLYYLGVIWEKPFAPWHAPFVLAYATTPLVLVAAFGGGLMQVRGVLSFVRKGINSKRSEEGATALYVLLHLFTTIGIVAFLGSPKYGGVKLFLPFFPFVALLVAVGVDAASKFVLQALPRLQKLAPVIVVTVAALVLLPAAVATTMSHPFGISYYGAGIGGLRGATALGFERQYYDVADKELAAWFNANAAKGARVHFEPNNKEYVKTYRWLARDGYLRNDIRVVNQSDADYVVLMHERRWASYPDLAARLGSSTPVFEKRIDDVPLYTVYQGIK